VKSGYCQIIVALSHMTNHNTSHQRVTLDHLPLSTSWHERCRVDEAKRHGILQIRGYHRSN
jgi:hypothetical protein